MTLRSLLPALTAFIWAAPALAQSESSCATDTDCPRGFSCEVTGGSGCAVPACMEGETCPEPEPCVTEEYKSCVPGPCSTDADCGEGLVCVTNTSEICTDTAACPPDTDCIQEPSTCETVTDSRCAPPWIAECSVDADCGDGFDCVKLESCACSGSAGGAEPLPDSSGAGGATPIEPVPPEDNCVCEPSGEMYCQPRQIQCTTSANCPSEWTCEQNPETPVCASVDGSDCGTTGDPELLCMPPFWDMVVGSDVYASGEAAKSNNDGSQTASDPNSSTASSGDSGGCQLAAAPSGSGFGGAAAGLLLLGFALTRRRD